MALVAQSVPAAGYVQCIEDRGAGWDAYEVRIDNTGTRIRFSLGPERRSDAQLSFSESCDGLGFPSGHAAVATTLALVVPRRSSPVAGILAGGVVGLIRL